MLIIDTLQRVLGGCPATEQPPLAFPATISPSPTLSLPWNTYTATYLPKTLGIADVSRCQHLGPSITLSIEIG